MFEIMVERLEGHLERLQAVWDEELEEVNELLRGVGLQEISPDREERGVVS